MHEARSFKPSPSASALSPWLSRPQTRRKLGLFAGLTVMAVLLVAWIDGGEEPIRTIVQAVDLPADVSAEGTD